MRRLKYFVASSLDGYISRLDGSVDWIFPVSGESTQDYGMSKFFASVDIAVMGRKTWDKAQQLAPGKSFGPGIESFVFSHTEPTGAHKGTNFVSGDVGEWLWTIRQKPGKDLWLVGGGEMVQSFLSQRLVDEIGLAIHPRLLGQGIQLFPQPYPDTQLELIRTEPYSNGLVQVFYNVKR